jgi:hypothetical protein
MCIVFICIVLYKINNIVLHSHEIQKLCPVCVCVSTTAMRYDYPTCSHSYKMPSLSMNALWKNYCVSLHKSISCVLMCVSTVCSTTILLAFVQSGHMQNDVSSVCLHCTFQFTHYIVLHSHKLWIYNEQDLLEELFCTIVHYHLQYDGCNV